MNTIQSNRIFIITLFLILIYSCNQNIKKSEEIEGNIKETATELIEKEIEGNKDPIAKIEKAHNKLGFLLRDAIRLDILLYFGGKERLNGKMTFLTNSNQGKIELSDGNSIYFEKDRVFHSPSLKNPKSARFDAYTWMYFLLFPNKLSDPGTVWSESLKTKMNGETYNLQKLSFKPETGDAPDDWYMVYSDPETNIIQYTGYIVTANKTVEEAEKDPHAIGYENYQMVENIPIPMNWTFYEWTQNTGLGKTIGEASLSNVDFIDVQVDFFEVPEGFIEK
ncbi:MAG: hypothetical protein AAF688_02815 [Bacteroidota bacterium]